jgi:hypothetical protein
LGARRKRRGPYGIGTRLGHSEYNVRDSVKTKGECMILTYIRQLASRKLRLYEKGVTSKRGACIDLIYHKSSVDPLSFIS